VELLHGVIHGRVIELDNEPGLPDGQLVTVVVQPARAAIEESVGLPPHGSLKRAFGAWAEDTKDLDDYLECNRRQRKIGRTEVEP
jgi:hypothetical protein